MQRQSWSQREHNRFRRAEETMPPGCPDNTKKLVLPTARRNHGARLFFHLFLSPQSLWVIAGVGRTYERRNPSFEERVTAIRVL